ncbi:hypothetical protein FEM48_Zijuj04G0055800 [Ziziphus jujuba var. spinosa]|uniref:Uncharacterized protein n=1 Tax=Ziziphus jujuba var. spinosa TaxID=714518 RepID=A0A978VI36_ZIZJJ|nr:hypothetical protein FEM48_Zijuj04G0055800 [Ziziphus jujuba var. spinosa]
MNDVVWGLEFALQLQESVEENSSEMKGGDGVAFLSYSEDDGKFSCCWDDSEQNSGGTKPSSSDQSGDTNQSIKGISGTVF